MNSAVATSYAPVAETDSGKRASLADDLNWAEEATLRAHYEESVKPFAEEFEERRKSSIKTTGFASVVVIPVALSLMAAVAWFASIYFPPHQDVSNIVIFACMVIGFVSWKLISRPVNTFKGNVKAEIFPKIFAFFGDKFSYCEKSPIGMGDLKWSGLVPGHERARMEDYVKGEHAGTSIELVEACLTKQRRIGKFRQTVTVFDGICIVLGMNKNFTCKTVVKRDAGKVGNWFKNVFNSLDRVALEDPVFEGKFEVFSDDQVEARYLLSATFMERLMELQRLYGGSSIEASFHEDKLLLMIACKHNHFQASSIWDESTFLAETQTIVREMRSIFRIIDVLKLDDRTGL